MSLAQEILMIRPSSFNFNPETAESNAFQKKFNDETSEINKYAKDEFDALTRQIIAANIKVNILEEDANENLPDSIFPNNWFSTTESSNMILYPMLSPLRRKEKRTHFIDQIKKIGSYKSIIDLSYFETENKFLEGTGSIVFDHHNKMAYCCKSIRSDLKVLRELCEAIEYSYTYFNALDLYGKAIYHTNVLMSISNGSVVICLDSLLKEEKEGLIKSFQRADLKIIDISFEQMNNFCANILLVKNIEGKNFWLMSSRAYNAFNIDQIKLLENEGEIIHSDIFTIENYGGGGVRCMIAEIF